METDFHLVCMSHDFAAVSFCWFLLWYAIMVCVLQFFFGQPTKFWKATTFYTYHAMLATLTTHTTTKLHTYQACSLIHDFQRENSKKLYGILKPKYDKSAPVDLKLYIFGTKIQIFFYRIFKPIWTKFQLYIFGAKNSNIFFREVSSQNWTILVLQNIWRENTNSEKQN